MVISADFEKQKGSGWNPRIVELEKSRKQIPGNQCQFAYFPLPSKSNILPKNIAFVKKLWRQFKRPVNNFFVQLIYILSGMVTGKKVFYFQ